MIPRVRLSNTDIHNYEVRVIRIFKDAGAEKLNPTDQKGNKTQIRDKLYDYRVKDHKFKIDHSDYSFTVFYKKDDEDKEHKFNCNNEDNVVERVAALVRKLTEQS